MSAAVVFTDLDGTLLDAATYSWKEAAPALELLEARGIPLVLVTSKTRAEVEVLRGALGNRHPFVVENGGAAFIPKGYFPFSLSVAKARDGYLALEWGASYEELTAALKDASRESGCRVLGFSDMTTPEVAEACSFDPGLAALAKAREYDEPFLVLDAVRESRLLAAIEARGYRWTRGGRFHHICGDNDKAGAVAALRALFEQALGPMRSIGLGDAPNDAEFLAAVELPVLIPSAHLNELQRRIPHGMIPRREGPAGWNEAILGLLAA
ncbi:MAG: HAD-IIB family hydrolase [Bryobacteraceae bacterium]|nr:HAD-IIB family hydrolase [Bryobacteraceae bacterium]